MLRYASLADLLRHGRAALAAGPLAVILAEDLAEIESTLLHHVARGFARLLLFAPAEAPPLPRFGSRVIRIDHAAPADGTLPGIVTALIPGLPDGAWIYAGHNAEYLFHPYCDTRPVGALLAFLGDERRRAVSGCVVDLYAADLAAHPDGIDPASPMFDRTGYFALDRRDAGGEPLDRQVDLHGGLRHRFADHVAPGRDRIDRVVLFRARRGLVMAEDFTLNDAEMNTRTAPWHASPTCAVASFRAAKALMANPGSRADIGSFAWWGSTPFDWTPDSLLRAGLMEPGQWP